jgi:hypothetical protein
MLLTAFNGTILATGKTFTHGLGTTPDDVSVTDLSGTGGTWGMAPSVLTYDANTITVAGRVDGATVRIRCTNFAGATVVVDV